MTDRFQARPQDLKDLFLTEARKLFPKAGQIPEGVFIQHADESEELKVGGLKRRCREEQLVPSLESRVQDIFDDAGRFINVAQPMRFIDNHKVPGRRGNVAGPGSGELIRTDRDAVCSGEWLEVST